ncbi:class I SAM-dependent methyltransferase [Terriglobus roseus]|uniref:S-adenosyl-L-methionine-dependent methyltransferase n=1 Tax=Terriglobus roseus TaxID=392734 RepID=A0A1H4NE29_9BACT|nr:class I SAM-dependent methyltransferase [Terriglobus roseus]SEB93506.1 methyltransferase, TIGR00027 family [Terriglobus roseus]
MQEGKPSGTAYRVALRRAAHQVFDSPIVFRDPLALRILGMTPEKLGGTDLRAPSRPHSVGLRAFLVGRSRFAEDTLADAVATQGVTQYVLLGAGLDTFAYRNQHPGLRVFEVDHPDTQAWKLSLLSRTKIDVPSTVTHVAVDFHVDTLAQQLAEAGFDMSQPAVFAWLGVVPYLTDEGFTATMEFLSACAPGSELIFDYGLPPEALPQFERMAFESMASRVAAAGEPFQLFFMPDAIHERLCRMGWELIEDLDTSALNARYFAVGKLRALGSGAHMLSARLLPQKADG